MFAAFFAGAAHLFMLRYETGDVYPPYSTFRADPLGAKALFEALAKISSTGVERNTRELKKLALSPSPAVFVLGVPPVSPWWEETAQSAKSLAAITDSGGRMVVAFAPTRTYKGDEGPIPSIRMPQEDEDTRKAKSKREDDGPEGAVDLREAWDVRLERPESPTQDGQEDRRELTATASQPAGQSREIEWHSIAYFETADEAWKTIYTCDGKPVVIERALGAGSLVLLSDSYPFSNEAMRKNPETALLTWLIGSSERVVFDEMHHGILEKQGVMTLARKHRLHGFALGVLLLVLLFLWRHFVRLTPPYEDELDSRAWYSRGREASEGLTNLLRRSVMPRELLGTCLEEWKRAVGMRRPDSAKKVEQMQAIVNAQAANAAAADVVHAYRAMARIATERK